METDPLYTSTFAGALAALKDGKNVYRENWNGKNQWLGLQLPDTTSMNTLPYIYIMVQGGQNRVPWTASQTDLLANDWKIV